MTPAKSKVRPHLFTADPDVPARYDADGRLVNLGACRCGLVGEPGDAHHTLPPPVPDVQSLRAGERSGS